MEYDAIVAGVEPGGINNAQQVRILVGYVLRSVGQPVERRLLPELLQHWGIANFFEVSQAIDELVEKGSLSVNDADELELTERGLVAVDEWEFILPIAAKEKAAKAALAALTRLRTDRENTVEITPLERGFDVVCAVLDGEQKLLEIKLWLPDKLQAEAVKEQFLSDPLKLYSGTVALLTGNYSLLKEGK